MSNLYFDILDQSRRKLFENLKAFKSIGALAGGTAVSLFLGHRHSFDFDILSPKLISRSLLVQVNQELGEVKPTIDNTDELTFLIPNKIKVSFVFFPFKPLHKLVKTSSLDIFSLEDLASNKAYVIGRRGEYKDYFDLFAILKIGQLDLEKIINEAEKRFRGNFSKKLFLEQLTYFDDLKDFTIEFAEKHYEPEQIKKFFEKEIEKLLA